MLRTIVYAECTRVGGSTNRSSPSFSSLEQEVPCQEPSLFAPVHTND